MIYDFIHSGSVTSIITSTGKTDYAISMKYKCNNCGTILKGNKGELYHQFDFDILSAYPVDARYTLNNEVHYDKSLTNLNDELMPNPGNSGNQLCKMIYRI